MKKLDADSPIDASLFGHIQNDAFLSGTFELEGSQFQRTLGYLKRYFDQLSAKGPLPEAALAIQKRMSSLLEIENDICSLSTVGDNAPSVLDKLTTSIAQRVRTLGQGDYLSMPGGWQSMGGSHAIIYQFKRTATSLEFYIHNAGEGIQYHEKQSATDRELYYPVQAYSIPFPCDPKKLKSFIRDLIVPMVTTLRSEQDKAFDAEKLYETVLPRIAYLGAELISVKDKKIYALTAGQLSGTCAERCLHQMWKANSSTEQVYQRDIYNFKRYALDDYMKVLKSENNYQDKGVKSQVTHAISTLIKTLNIPGLFNPDEITAQLADLDTYRQLFTAKTIKEQTAVEEEKMFPSTGIKASPLPTTFNYIGYVQMSAPTVSPVNAQQKATTTLPKPLKGGDALLTELASLRKECEQLKASGQSQCIFERLEQVFVHFPLPSPNEPFDKKIDFYSGINLNNRAAFYEHIESLQTMYADACVSLFGAAALPRKLVVSVSVVSILDYVGQQFPLDGPGKTHFHALISKVLMSVFQGNCFNPYFATNNPALDSRLKQINALYINGPEYQDLEGYYKSIIDSEPELKEKLRSLYIPPENAKFDKLLRAKNAEALYVLISKFDEINSQAKYKPLMNKIKQYLRLAKCVYKSLEWAGLVYSANDKPDLTFHQSAGVFVVEDYLSALRNFHGKIIFLQHKYGPLDNTPSRLALMADFFESERNITYKTRAQKPCSDNDIQLFENDVVSSFRKKFSPRQINKQEMVNREYFHLRNSPSHQIKLTLDYFLNHLTKLSDQSCQWYVEANLFEPGLLLKALDKNPGILNQIDHFVRAGLHHFSDRGFSTQPSLFFIRLAFLVDRYTAQYKPDLGTPRLDTLQQRITALLQVDKDNDPAVQQWLHQYQFFTAMARFEHARVLTEDQHQLLELALSSYFYMNTAKNLNLLMDSATQFDLDCAKHQFQRLVAQSDPELVRNFVQKTMTNLEFGVCDIAPTKESSVFTARTQQGVVYTVNTDMGLVFNANGMARVSIPLDILNHPVMPYLGVNKLQYCLKSSDGCVFELDQKGLRFIREGSSYKVQKKWTIGNKTQWFELKFQNKEQEEAFKIKGNVITLLFPDALKQRDTQVWACADVKNMDDQRLLITVKNSPAYFCIPSQLVWSSTWSPTRQWTAMQLDKNGVENGFTLGIGETWIHQLFSKFEQSNFITVCQRENTFQIKFDRYGLNLLARQEQGEWLFYLENNPSCRLVMDATPAAPGVVGLVFEDITTKKRECYLPLQPFLRRDGISARSEFHQLHQDIDATLPKAVIDKIVGNSSLSLLPWQYSGSERLVHYTLDQKGQPIAETASDALYLCYVYLGSQHPEKAWAVLEDCLRRFRGLQGTAEELSYLNLIINALPPKLYSKDKKAVISTPAYVACQLKALSLFTNAFTPDQVITWPSSLFNLKTPDGIYQNFRLDEDKAFYKGLNNTIYQLYSRFQRMQRHLEHPFLLDDAERKSLLDYYHFHLPGKEPKALGALGYEWQRLALKDLRKEYLALRAKRDAEGALPKAYQKRLAEIEQYLTKEDLVRAHHSNLALLAIDLSIERRIDFDKEKIDETVLRPLQFSSSSFWHSFNRAVPQEKALREAMEALTPDITLNEFFQHFRAYYEILTKNPPHPQREACLLFCRQYLIAHSRVSLIEQKENATFLCNILYRIAVNYNDFRAAFGNGDFLDLIKQAQKLPDPDIRIYQLQQVSMPLASAADIWKSLEKEVPVPGPMMAAGRCAILDGFNINKLLEGLPKINEKAVFCNDYKKEDDAFNVPEVGVSEVEAGERKYQALVAMKAIAAKLLGDLPFLTALQTKAETFIATLSEHKQASLDMALALANEGPTDPEAKRRYDLEIASGARAPFNLEQLLTLYFKADKANYKIVTGLTDEKIASLHTALGHYLALSIRQQGLERLQKSLKDAVKTPDESTLQLVAHELLTDNLVSVEHDPVMTIIQYQEGILLRPQQQDAIRRLLTSHQQDPHAYQEVIEKIGSFENRVGRHYSLMLN